MWMPGSEYKGIAVLDIDGVLANSIPRFVELNNAFFKTKIDVSEYSDNWSKTRWHEGYTEEAFALRNGVEWVEYMEGTDFYRTLPVMAGAVEKTEYMCNVLRLRLELLTSRRKEFLDDTLLWLKANFPNTHFYGPTLLGAYDSLSVSASAAKKTKGELVVQLGATSLMDDCPKHVLSVVGSNASGILFGTGPEAMAMSPREEPWLYRAKNWSEAIEIYKLLYAS